ncbi:DUF420 domain-containing protein [Nocardia stercoris]|uniref:DUF420 domain-containing protein n=2 Tax=Nocardia stercoris TaxID=2483361 RepID=A0A3M2KUZ7_9NOCA|nr:DUF420 domain-containing protein [Nocardia stercoris]
MDTMVLVMAVVLAVLAWSVYQVRVKRKFGLHKRTQVALAVGLLISVGLFEVDVRFNGWEERASGVAGGRPSGLVWTALGIQLVFAVFAVVLWPVVIVRAARELGSPPLPGAHSVWHRRWAPLAAIGMALAGATSWVFYWLAFAA